MSLNVSSKIRLFADDACLYHSIKTEEDISILQNDLNALVRWENDWSIEFNPSKCNLLRIRNKKKIIEGDYTIRGQQLKSVDKAKYLGVTIHKNLNWKPHINEITAKANNCRRFLQRNLVTSDRESRLQCYKIFVRPVVEYASTVWDPVENKTLQTKIEMVLRKAARWTNNQWSRDQRIHYNGKNYRIFKPEER